MTVIQPYLDRYTKMDLLSGRLTADLNVLLLGDGGMATNGVVQVDKFRTVDKAQQEDFLKWDVLRAEGFSYDGRTGLLHIKHLKTRGAYARVIIAKDETLNVAEIFTPANPAPAYQASIQYAAAEGPPAAETQIRIDTVSLRERLAQFRGLLDPAELRGEHREPRGHDRRPLHRSRLAREARPRRQGGPLRAGDHRRRDEPALGDALHQHPPQVRRRRHDLGHAVLRPLRRLQDREGQALDRRHLPRREPRARREAEIRDRPAPARRQGREPRRRLAAAQARGRAARRTGTASSTSTCR